MYKRFSPFRGLYAILYKELLTMLRDPLTIFFAFLPPLIQVLAFGFAIKTDVKHTPAVLLNQDGRQASRELVSKIENTQYIDIIREVKSEKEMMSALTRGEVYVGIKIPPDYSNNLAIGKSATFLTLIDGSNNTLASQALNVSNNVAFMSSLEQLTRQSGTSMKNLPIESRPKVLYNPDLRSENFFVPGVIGVALQLVTTFLTAFAIVRERERGTLEQLMVTPLSKFGLLLGKMIPYILLAWAEAMFLFWLLVVVFKVPIAGSFLLLMLLTTLFIFVNLSIGLLISTKATSQVQAVQMSMVTLLPSVFLSGFIFPRFTMPWIFYSISSLLPATYYMNILRGIILRSASLEDLSKDVLILSGMGLLLFLAAMVRFKKKLS